MAEADLHRAVAYAVLGLGAITFVALCFIVAPYGRHARRGFGPTLPARLGWVLMESPAVLGFAAVYALGARRADAAPLALLALWQIHYLHRTLIFPFRLRAAGRRMPALIAGLGFLFNGANAWMNARGISHLGVYPAEWLASPWFLAGAALFATGMLVNVTADETLLRLRAGGEAGYHVPRGGLYRWISCPNYLGEMLEWAGWALATCSLAGLAFAVYSVANLAPRALAHHRWYRARFPDYPPERRALIPFVL